MEIECSCGNRRFEVPPGENVHCPRCGRAYTGLELKDENSIVSTVVSYDKPKKIGSDKLITDPIKFVKSKKKKKRRRNE